MQLIFGLESYKFCPLEFLILAAELQDVKGLEKSVKHKLLGTAMVIFVAEVKLEIIFLATGLDFFQNG